MDMMKLKILSFPPEVLVKPQDADQVAEIMKLASKEYYTCYSNWCKNWTKWWFASLFMVELVFLWKGSIKLLQIDQDNLQVHVQPGVITQVLQEK